LLVKHFNGKDIVLFHFWLHYIYSKIMACLAFDVWKYLFPIPSNIWQPAQGNWRVRQSMLAGLLTCVIRIISTDIRK